jgi:transposase InsO family protein
VYAILRREGLGRLDRLEPRAPIVRYERDRPGELVHLDTKMLGRIGPGGGHRILGIKVNRHRGIGWNRVHLAIDDHSRLAYAEELADESPATTAAFLERAWRFYAAHGITIERILTDNGGCYRSRDFAAACDQLGIGHRWTRPYRPQTNGKAERLVRTLLAEWAYAEPFTEPGARVASLARYLDFYNRRRPHWSLAGQPPISRVPVNNLTGKNS